MEPKKQKRSLQRRTLVAVVGAVMTFVLALGIVATALQTAFAGESTSATGSATIYYNIQKDTRTSFTIGDNIYISSTDLSDETYASTTSPFSAELKIGSQSGSSYSVTVVKKDSAFDECTSGTLTYNNGWYYSCSGGAVVNAGPYGMYTVQQATIDGDDVSITETNVPDSGTVTSSNVSVKVTLGGKTYTLDSEEYTFPDSTLDAANGDCTYSVAIGGLTITKFDSSHANSVIDNNPNLTDDDKTALKTQLDNATNNDGVKSILAQAESAASDNLDYSKTENKTSLSKDAQNAKDEIDNLTNLTDAEKQAYKDAIDQYKDEGNGKIDECDTIAEANTTYAAYKAKIQEAVDAAKLQDAKNEATQDILEQYVQDVAGIIDLDNLSDADKLGYAEELEKAKDTALKAIENATDEAGVQAAKDAYEKAAQDIKDKAIAQNHVNKYLLDENGDFIDEFDSSNLDKVLEGKAAYDKLSDAQKALVDEAIKTQSGGKYTSYEDYAKAAQDAVDASAEDFIDKYVSDEADNIYTEANGSNYAQILSGLEDWNKLSQAEKDAIDAKLLAAGGEKYEDLIADAQAIDEARDGFIEKYLTGSDGKLFTEATRSNYAQILSGKDAWDKLTQAEKDAINAELVASGGKTYEELLAQAQAIQEQIEAEKAAKKAKTGDDTNSLLWYLLLVAGIIGGTVVFLYRRKKNGKNLDE